MPSQPRPLAAKAVNLRVREDIRDLIDRAAHAQGRSRSDFMIDASRRAAEEALLDQTFFSVSEQEFNAFEAMLDRKPEPNEKLRKLLQRKPAWERD